MRKGSHTLPGLVFTPPRPGGPFLDTPYISLSLQALTCCCQAHCWHYHRKLKTLKHRLCYRNYYLGCGQIQLSEKEEARPTVFSEEKESFLTQVLLRVLDTPVITDPHGATRNAKVDSKCRRTTGNSRSIYATWEDRIKVSLSAEYYKVNSVNQAAHADMDTPSKTDGAFLGCSSKDLCELAPTPQLC